MTQSELEKISAKLPRAMVLEYEPSLTCCVWKDYLYRNRSLKTLIAALKKEEALRRILNYPVHSEPVGSAYAMQEIAEIALEHESHRT